MSQRPVINISDQSMIGHKFTDCKLSRQTNDLNLALGKGLGKRGALILVGLDLQLKLFDHRTKGIRFANHRTSIILFGSLFRYLMRNGKNRKFEC